MKVKTDLKAGEGLGDCIQKISEALGIDRIADRFEQATGQNCGCAARQEILNQWIPQV